METFDQWRHAKYADRDWCAVCGASRPEAEDICALLDEHVEGVLGDDWEENNCLASHLYNERQEGVLVAAETGRES